MTLLGGVFGLVVSLLPFLELGLVGGTRHKMSSEGVNYRTEAIMSLSSLVCLLAGGSPEIHEAFNRIPDAAARLTLDFIM